MEEIIEELAKLYNLPEHIVKNVVTHPFKYTVETMQEEEMKPFRHPYLGVFGVKPSRRKHFEEINKKKEDGI